MQFYANANWQFMADWTLDGQYFWIADRHRANGDPRPDIADYDLVNLTLRRKNILKNWEAALAIKNVFNQDAREPSPPASAPFDKGITYDYPMESRSIWGEVRYTF
jgi:iron complex outermembrane receptor protein